MRHIFLYFFPYALFVYPTLSIYLIIAKRSTGRSGQLEKDGKVGKQNSTNQTDQSHYNIAEIPRQHKPPDCSPVHEPDLDSGLGWGQSQLYQHCCSSLGPEDATTIEVEFMSLISHGDNIAMAASIIQRIVENYKDVCLFFVKFKC